MHGRIRIAIDPQRGGREGERKGGRGCTRVLQWAQGVRILDPRISTMPRGDGTCRAFANRPDIACTRAKHASETFGRVLVSRMKGEVHPASL